MSYKRLANGVMWFHWVWIVLLLGGSSIQVFYGWYRPIHWTIVTTTLVSQLMWLGCPLMALENALRRKEDPTLTYYNGSFVCHYLRKKFGVEIQPLAITATLGVVALITIGTICY